MEGTNGRREGTMGGTREGTAPSKALFTGGSNLLGIYYRCNCRARLKGFKGS
jgi:hypothetical protein